MQCITTIPMHGIVYDYSDNRGSYKIVFLASIGVTEFTESIELDPSYMGLVLRMGGRV